MQLWQNKVDNETINYIAGESIGNQQKNRSSSCYKMYFVFLFSQIMDESWVYGEKHLPVNSIYRTDINFNTALI